MSPFFNILLSSLHHLLLISRSYLYLTSFPFRISYLSPQLLHLKPLQVYTHRLHTDTKPPNDSSPTVPSSTTSVLLSLADPPIPIQKDTCSSRNPYPIYNFLSYHRLSLLYYAFISTLSSISLPNTAHEALSHPTRNRQWLKKWLLCILLAHVT